MTRLHFKTISTIAVTIVVAVGFFAFVQISYAATITWTAAGSSNWTTSSSWSGGVVPTSADDVIFSASSTQTVTITSNINMKSMAITSVYSGTFTHTSGSITVASGGWSQAAGTFNGSALSGDVVNVSGTFALTGGVFKATIGKTVLNGDVILSGTFQHNSGTVILNAMNGAVTGSSTFYVLQLAGGGVYDSGSMDHIFSITTGTILTVVSTTAYAMDTNATVYLLGGGEIDAKGDITSSGMEVLSDTSLPTSTFNLVLNGSVTQTITGQTSDANAVAGKYFYLPSVTVNKSGGNVNLKGYIGITGNFNNQNASSTFVPGTSTLMFAGVSSTLSGSSILNNIWFGLGEADGSSSATLSPGTILTAQGALFFYAKGDSSVVSIFGGEIDVSGNIGAGDTAGYASSTTSIVLNSTSTQTIGDTSICHNYAHGMSAHCGTITFLPNPTITKTSGSVLLVGLINVKGTWTNTNATTIDPGSSTVVFGSGESAPPGYSSNFVALSFSWPSAGSPSATTTFFITGSSTFYNLILGDTSSPASSTIGNSIGTVATGTIITVNGYFAPAANGNYIQLLGGGEFDIKGDISTQDSSGQYATSTVSIIVNGTSTQTVGINTFGRVSDTYVRFPNLTITKPTSSVAYLQAPAMSVFGPVIVSRGEFNIASSAVAQSIRIIGGITVNSGAVLTDAPSTASSSISISGAITNNGLMWFAGDGSACAVPLPNYVIISPDVGTAPTWSGSGTFLFRYTSLQGQNAAVPISLWNGTDAGSNTGSWTFSTGLPRSQLVQSATSSSASASSLALPAFGIKPHAGDLIVVAVSAKSQSISAPTDNASNTYLLAASTSFNSGTYALNVYYAKNINTTSSFVVTVNGGAGGSPLSGAAFEYTGMAPSSTLDSNLSANTSYPATSTTITSLSATGQSADELYFGAMTINASTTASPGSGWTALSGINDNNTKQALYAEAQPTSSIISTAATWTAATSTNYAALMVIFRTPYASGYTATGTLDSATFDTRVTAAQFNSIRWQGSQSNGTAAKFQLAVSNSSAGPWNFIGPDGSANTYFSGSPNTSISLVGTSGGTGYNIFSGYRYYRYRITLFSDVSLTYTPVVNQVVINWSP